MGKNTMKLKIILLIIVLFLSAVSYIIWIRFQDGTVIFHGDSMVPTIVDGAEITIVPYNRINRYDIIVFKTSQGLSCKRVIGLPTETILIEKDGIKVDGKILQLPTPLSTASHLLLYPYIENPIRFSLKCNQYFVIGDNPVRSYDSRSYGAIDKTQIIGKIKKNN